MAPIPTAHCVADLCEIAQKLLQQSALQSPGQPESELSTISRSDLPVDATTAGLWHQENRSRCRCPPQWYGHGGGVYWGYGWGCVCAAQS